MGQHEESLKAYHECLKVRPDHVEALSNLSVALTTLKRYDEAIACCDQALAIRPTYAEAWHNRGNTLRAQKRWDEALADFERSIALKPDLADAHNNVGIIFHEQGRREEALAAFDRAQALNPNLSETHGNRANVLRELNRFDEALAEYDTAIALKSGLRDAHNNRAICLAEMRRIEECLVEFEEAARIDPSFAEAPWNKGVILLMLGQDAEGWRLYEKRWKRIEFDSKPNPYGKTPWLGERDIAGKVLLVTAEQGIGDTLQMLRYIPLLAQKGIKVVAAVQSALVELTRGVEGVWSVLGENQPIPYWNEFIPTMSPAPGVRRNCRELSARRALCVGAERGEGAVGAAAGSAPQAAHRPRLVGQPRAQERPQPLDPAADPGAPAGGGRGVRLPADRLSRGRPAAAAVQRHRQPAGRDQELRRHRGDRGPVGPGRFGRHLGGPRGRRPGQAPVAAAAVHAGLPLAPGGDGHPLVS
ncbi:MAG: tetratricopeptide repeat protein [Caulobacteraceae bacterium]